MGAAHRAVPAAAHCFFSHDLWRLCSRSGGAAARRRRGSCATALRPAGFRHYSRAPTLHPPSAHSPLHTHLWPPPLPTHLCTLTSGHHLYPPTLPTTSGHSPLHAHLWPPPLPTNSGHHLWPLTSAHSLLHTTSSHHPCPLTSALRHQGSACSSAL